MPKQVAWEPCPRCQSSRVEKRDVVYSIGMGLALLLVGAPVGGLVLSALTVSAGLVGGALLAILGVLLMLTAPFLPKRGHCRDCQKDWQFGQAA